MRSAYIGKIDWFLLFLVLAAAFIGILNLYGQEAVMIENGRPFFEQKWVKQSIRLLIALFAMVFVALFHYQVIGSYAHGIYLFSIFLLILTLVMGDRVKGALSWLSVFGVRIGQPAEFAKLATIILLSKYLILKEKDISRLSELVIPFAILVIPMVLILKQPDFGTALSFIPIFFTILFFGGADIWQIGSLVALGFFTITIPMYVEYHKRSLLDPLYEILTENGAAGLANAARRLGKDVWDAVGGAGLSSRLLERKGVSGLLEEPENMDMLRSAIEQVKIEHGGLLLRFFENETALLVLGSLALGIAVTLWIYRMVSGVNFKRVMLPSGVVGLTLLSVLFINTTVSFSDYQITRLTAFVNPEKFKDAAGYQLRASKIAIGSGRFFGNGLTHDGMTSGSIPLVPEAATDFAFTSWGERFGFAGAMVLLFILFAIPLRGLQIAFESKDRFGAMLASGVTAMLFYHIFINIGIVLGLMPVTGLPLSFISYGGSNLIISFMGIGLLLNIKLRKYAN